MVMVGGGVVPGPAWSVDGDGSFAASSKERETLTDGGAEKTFFILAGGESGGGCSWMLMVTHWTTDLLFETKCVQPILVLVPRGP